MVERRAWFEICPDIRDQKARGNRRAYHGDSSALQVREGDGSLPCRTSLQASDFRHASGEIASEQGHIFCEVKMRIYQGQVIQSSMLLHQEGIASAPEPLVRTICVDVR